MWVPPLILERRSQLAPNNPYFEHATYNSWIAYRDGKPVGRISAQIDQLHLDRYQDATGFFGMLEAENNSATFQLLMETAETWLRQKGMRRVAGPYNLSINQELGLLVDGFDTPPGDDDGARAALLCRARRGKRVSQRKRPAGLHHRRGFCASARHAGDHGPG